MKTQLLDPLGAMCKLIALNFNEIKTKISIHDHILTLQEPNGTQWLVRLYNGDGRENTSELYYAIIRLVKWFLMAECKNIRDDLLSFENSNIEETTVEEMGHNNALLISQSKSFRKLVMYLCNALKNLQNTYKTGNVVLALQFYINILEDGLNNMYNDNRLPFILREKEKEYETFLDYDKIKNMWDVKKIERICELYDDCFAIQKDDSYKDGDKVAFIEGYLQSIKTILDSADKDFQALIDNSNNG